ncbi:hypothetical protein AFUB_013700 [Aspergillus fumigatus A1163]|uniref:Uncharacterized protein n=1 Tax=Aspergillus fumigatus (strain CBS 144.89 / FGSC A1163 / CEA10) TaxID=451804 RepID=B0XMP6_ASPFC|nr:hypothetical protein AFUB_013700 [Aspergillus fumigatus A1163]
MIASNQGYPKQHHKCNPPLMSYHRPSYELPPPYSYGSTVRYDPDTRLLLDLDRPGATGPSTDECFSRTSTTSPSSVLDALVTDSSTTILSLSGCRLRRPSSSTTSILPPPPPPRCARRIRLPSALSVVVDIDTVLTSTSSGPGRFRRRCRGRDCRRDARRTRGWRLIGRDRN